MLPRNQTIVQIRKQSRLKDGTIRIDFKNDIAGDLKRTEYDRKLRRLNNNEDNLSREALVAARVALGKRPTEVLLLACAVRPELGFFVTKMQIRTAHEKGKIVDYSFECGELELNKGLFIPKSYTTKRTIGGITSELKLVIESVNFNEKGEDNSSMSRLPYYKLAEPETGK